MLESCRRDWVCAISPPFYAAGDMKIVQVAVIWDIYASVKKNMSFGVLYTYNLSENKVGVYITFYCNTVNDVINLFLSVIVICLNILFLFFMLMYMS